MKSGMPGVDWIFVFSTLEFFMSGSMAKVLTLLAVVGILMLRPQGLFALKVRK